MLFLLIGGGRFISSGIIFFLIILKSQVALVTDGYIRPSVVASRVGETAAPRIEQFRGVRAACEYSPHCRSEIGFQIDFRVLNIQLFADVAAMRFDRVQ